MNGIIMTPNFTFIIEKVAWVLGKIMEGIFKIMIIIEFLILDLPLFYLL